MSLNELTGVGEEWLLDSYGNIRAIFYNGNLKRDGEDNAYVDYERKTATCA